MQYVPIESIEFIVLPVQQLFFCDNISVCFFCVTVLFMLQYCMYCMLWLYGGNIQSQKITSAIVLFVTLYTN
jgi:hypothetical protein